MSDIEQKTPVDDDPKDEEGIEIPRRRPRGEPVDAGSSKRGLLVAVGLTMVAAAVVGVILTSIEDNGIYAKPVDELVNQKSKFTGRPVRAEGTLVPGTLVKRESPCEYRFTLVKNKVEMPVSFKQCVVPDTFRDVPGMDVSVTVEGELRADNFEANKVIAKCPSKYEMQEKQKRGEAMPHGNANPNPDPRPL